MGKGLWSWPLLTDSHSCSLSFLLQPPGQELCAHDLWPELGLSCLALVSWQLCFSSSPRMGCLTPGTAEAVLGVPVPSVSCALC